MAFYLAFYLTSILTFYLTFSSVEEISKKGTRDKAREGSGRGRVPCSSTNPQLQVLLQLRSGRERCHLALAVEVWQGTLPELAVRARGNTLILSLLFRSGGKHCAGEVRKGGGAEKKGGRRGVELT